MRIQEQRRKGVAWVVVAIVLGLAFIGGTAAYIYLQNQTANIQTPTTSVIEATNILDHVSVNTAYNVIIHAFIRQNVTIYYTPSFSQADIYLINYPEIGNDEIQPIFKETIKHGGTISIILPNQTVVLAVNGIYADAIIINWQDGNYNQHLDSDTIINICKKIRIKTSWWDVLWESFGKTFDLAKGMLTLTFQTVISFLPYVGFIWVIWLVGAVIKCVEGGDLDPLVDFFYKNYYIAFKIASLVSKLIDIITGPFT